MTATTKTSLKQQAFSIQNKLVQLSLEIEDQEKTVNLLNKRLQTAGELSDKEQKEIGDRWRSEFKKQSR